MVYRLYSLAHRPAVLYFYFILLKMYLVLESVVLLQVFYKIRDFIYAFAQVLRWFFNKLCLFALIFRCKIYFLKLGKLCAINGRVIGRNNVLGDTFGAWVDKM